MEWSTLPVELFGLITTYCSSTMVLKLEYACKAWKENLREEWIWKDIATKTTSGFALPMDIYDWKAVALKRQFTIKNMREKRCISRSFASAEYTRGYNEVNHYCSVSGDEALITWTNVQANSSYNTSSFLAHEMVNLITGKREPINLFENTRALLTKHFIVTSQAGQITCNSECTSELNIADRRTNNLLKPKKMKIPEIGKKGRIYKNEDPNYQNGSVIAISSYDNKNCLVVDLDKRTTQKFAVPEEENQLPAHLTITFYGKYLAMSRTVTEPKTIPETRQIIIFDTETEKLIYRNKVKANAISISNNRIALVTCSKFGIEWVVYDFKNNVVAEVTSNVPQAQALAPVSVRFYGDILLVLSFARAWFCDIKNSKILCDLHLIGWPEYGPYIQHDMIGTGKFVISSVFSSRIIDFESIAIIKEFKPQIILPEHDYGIIDEWKRPIAFHELMEFAMKVVDEPSTKYASILISEDEDKKERTSLIFLAGKYYQTKITGPENKKATELIKTMAPAHRSVNMVMARFTYDASYIQTHVDFVKSTDTVQGRAVLYKEKFINGEWIPVDF